MVKNGPADSRSPCGQHIWETEVLVRPPRLWPGGPAPQVSNQRWRQTTTNQPSHIPPLIAYHPVLCSISTIIQTHFKILSSSPRCNSVFQTTPLKLVAFRRTDNLSDILVRSKLRTDKQTNVTKGSFRCGKNCITCRYFTDGRTNDTFSATGEMTTIHDRVDCNCKNLVYMIHCLRCNK